MELAGWITRLIQQIFKSNCDRQANRSQARSKNVARPQQNFLNKNTIKINFNQWPCLKAIMKVDKTKEGKHEELVSAYPNRAIYS